MAYALECVQYLCFLFVVLRPAKEFLCGDLQYLDLYRVTPARFLRFQPNWQKAAQCSRLLRTAKVLILTTYSNGTLL